jgi:hypothetical protein
MVSKLLQSDIFMHKFDYDLWPSTNLCGQKVLKHYNGSKFHLRNMYSEIFKDFNSDEIHEHNED